MIQQQQRMCWKQGQTVILEQTDKARILTKEDSDAIRAEYSSRAISILASN